MRASVIAAVAWRDLRRVMSGRKRWALPLLAAALLLPTGALPMGPAASPPSAQSAPLPPGVRGEIPDILLGQLRADPTAEVRILPGPPITVEAPWVSRRLRAALDSQTPQPAVVFRRHSTPLRLPGRTLLVALIAISLLTGPLAESLPGEREENTFETLLAAALSRWELVLGKWLAWTSAASGAALLAAISGIATGAQSPGPWLLGLPLALGVAVAVGLWLVRQAGDLIGGAAAPMRVIPSAAVLALGLAWGASQASPLLGAALPLGGALLLTGGILDDPASIAVCALSSLATIGALLAVTARDLQRTARRAGPSSATLLLWSALCWWLPVAAPATWSAAGRGDLVDASSGVRAAGILLVLLAATEAARRTRPAEWRRPSVTGILWGGASGGALALLSVLPTALPLDGPLATRFLAEPSGLLGAVALGAGCELVFRGTLTQRLGRWPALAAWVAIVCPLDPLLGIASGLIMGHIAHKHGLAAALAGGVLWRIL